MVVMSNTRGRSFINSAHRWDGQLCRKSVSWYAPAAFFFMVSKITRKTCSVDLLTQRDYTMGTQLQAHRYSRLYEVILLMRRTRININIDINNSETE